MSPSRGGWLQESDGKKYGQSPALVKASSLPIVSADELLYAAKLQRRRESVPTATRARCIAGAHRHTSRTVLLLFAVFLLCTFASSGTRMASSSSVSPLSTSLHGRGVCFVWSKISFCWLCLMLCGCLGFRPACFFGCVAVLLLSCSIAAVNVFVGTDAPLLQFFLYGLLWSLQLIVIALYLPYDSQRRNYQNVVVAFATLAHSAIFLGVQRGGVSSGYMVALLLVFALILAVLLLREKLAVGVPWLHVLRRADMKKQEVAIVEAAIELERQLTRALSKPANPQVSREVSSSAGDAPHHLIITSSPADPQKRDEVEGQPGAAAASSSAPPIPPELTLRLAAEYQRELEADAERARVALGALSDAPHGRTGKDSPSASDTSRSIHSPASPSLHHHRAVSQGPGQLFVPRASVATDTKNDAASPRLSPRSAISGAVQLAPLRPHASNGGVHISDASGKPSISAGALPPIRLSRALPPPSPLPSTHTLQP